MFVKPRFVQFLTSVSVASMFIVTPVVGKIDGLGKMRIATASANALVIDPYAPPTGPTMPPMPPTGPVTPPTDPEGPPTDPVVPPTDPVVPPTDPVDPPTDPVDPPIGPVDPPFDPGEVCDQKDAPDSCNDPKPAVPPQTQDNGDDVPSSLPVKPADTEKTAQEEGMEFAESLRCQTECKVEVAKDGDVEVTLTSTTPEGDTVKTTIKQDGPAIKTRLSINDLTVAEVKELFESVTIARDKLSIRATDIVVSLEASGDKWAKLLSDPVSKAQSIGRLTPLIAEFLGVEPEMVVISSLEAV